MKNLKPGTTDFPWPTIEFSALRASGFMRQCKGIAYGYGSKAPFHGAVPHKDFTSIDCSGFVREMLWVATPADKRIDIVDGSFNQHRQIREAGFKVSSPDSAKARDGVLRIAFLNPEDGTNGVGHVALVLNGQTYESCGGFGVCRRTWTGKRWQAKCHVYVLDNMAAYALNPEIKG